MSSSSSPLPPPSLGVGILLRLAWPVMLARSTQAVMGFFDGVMTAPLGEDALAATTTGAINAFAVIILPMGIVMVVQSFAGQLAGRGDPAGARRYGWYGLILSGVVALIGLAALPFIGPALGLFDYAPGVRALMTDYLVLRMTGLGAVVAGEALGNWYGGLGNTRAQLMANIVAMAIDLLLNWVLIYGHLGAPAMGVSGAALASAIGSWVGFALLLAMFLRRSGVPATMSVAPSSGRLRAMELWRMLRFGLPNGLNWLLEFAAFAVFINVVVAHLGTASLAAMMVVININAVSFMPAFGISSAGAILAAQAIGAGRREEVARVLRLTMATTATWQVAVGIFYVAMPTALLTLFAPPGPGAGALVAIGSGMLAISAAWQLFDAIGVTLAEILRAAGDTAWCFYARIALAWATFIPAAVLVVIVFGGGHIGAILCMAGYIAALAAVLAWRFRGGRWRDIDLTGADPVASMVQAP